MQQGTHEELLGQTNLLTFLFMPVKMYVKNLSSADMWFISDWSESIVLCRKVEDFLHIEGGMVEDKREKRIEQWRKNCFLSKICCG